MRIAPFLCCLALVAGSASVHCVQAADLARRLPFEQPAVTSYIVMLKDFSRGISPSVVAASGGHIVDSIPELNMVVLDDVTNSSALYADANVSLVAENLTVTIPPGEMGPFEGIEGALFSEG
jgi:hypothetical protein